MANIRLGLLDDDRRNLVGVGATTSQTAKFRARDGKQGPHPTKVNGKFYWLHMTNPVAKIPFCKVDGRTWKKEFDTVRGLAPSI